MQRSLNFNQIHATTELAKAWPWSELIWNLLYIDCWIMNSSIRRNERSDITASKLQQPPHFTNPHNASKSLHEVHHSQILWFKLIGALEVPNYHYQRLRNMVFKMPHMCQHFWWLHYMLQQLTIGSSITIRINYHRLLLSHWGIGGRYTMLLAPFALFQLALTTIRICYLLPMVRYRPPR